MNMSDIASARAVISGKVRVPGGEVYWKKVGSGPGTPLLVLHGGPGSAHDYMLPMSALGDERPVIFYDQLGCGLSDAPTDPSIYTIPRAAEELQAVRDGLGLDRVILSGHSWGGMLAIEYLCASEVQGVEKLILGGCHADMRQCSAGMQRLLMQLPDGAGHRLKELEAAGMEASPDYEEIANSFYRAHVCRLDPWPDALLAALANTGNSLTYQVMNGPNEFTCVGVIKDWYRKSDLDRIDMPTLVITGEYDEVTLDCHEDLVKGIPDARLEVLPGCSHLLMHEAPDLFNATLRQFMA
jgi:proline iminopeptidase